MLRPGLSVLAAVCLWGCGEAPPEQAVEQAATLPAEKSWHAQLEAVRAGESVTLRVTESSVTSTQFRALTDSCSRLKTLVIDQGQIENEDLAVLSDLPELRWLKLPVRVDDRGVGHISRCRDLEMLNLPNGEFSDAGCEQFAQLDKLILLRFRSPSVTDRGIAKIAQLPRLRFLHLIDVPITDAGLQSIAAIDSLESFYLDGGNVTDGALEKLLTARPDLHFHRDQVHLPGDPNDDGHGPDR